MMKRFPIILGLILLAFSLWLQITPFYFAKHLMTRLENLVYDMQLRTRLFAQKKFSTPIIIVDVDDKSLKKEGRWPWPRLKLAELVNHLRTAGAVVIAFDTLFSEKEDNITDLIIAELRKKQVNPHTLLALKEIAPLYDYDIDLAKSIKQIDTILGMSLLPSLETHNLLPKPLMVLTSPEEKTLAFFTAKGYINNIPLLETASKSVAFVNVYADPDGIIRKIPLLLRLKDSLYPSLALEAVRIFLLSQIKLVTAPYHQTLRLEGIQIGNHTIPTNANAEVIIPFRGKSFTFPYYSATDVLHGHFPKNIFLGKIVFIGTSATGLGDLHTTAIQSAFPGVEIHATIADGILQNTFSYRPAWSIGAEIFITTFIGLLVVFLFPFLGPRSLTLLMIIIPLALFFANSWLLEKTGLILTLIVPMVFAVAIAIINIVYGYLFETLRRERLKEMFGQYVPAKHIDEMLTSTGNYGLHGEDREMTVLFADIRNFTTLSEPLSASELKDLLSEFFTPMTEIIFKYRGTIDKYVGDMIMAFWGAPLKDKRHAQHAVLAAIDMQLAVQKLKKVFREHHWPEVTIGIGLNTGLMSVGDMGSRFRRNYTVLGDAVNLASRIEGLTKFYAVNMIVGEDTQQEVAHVLFRLLDRVKVKGKEKGVEIYEIIGKQEDISLELRKEIEMSNTALAHYFNQAWDTAEKLFNELFQQHPEVKFYKLYLERIAEFKKNPPPKNWDGVFEHVIK